jgi:hypothetical protein
MAKAIEASWGEATIPEAVTSPRLGWEAVCACPPAAAVELSPITTVGKGVGVARPIALHPAKQSPIPKIKISQTIFFIRADS